MWAMTYPEKLLADGEHVEFEMRPHWKAILPSLAWLLGVVVIGFFLMARWGSWFDGAVGTWGSWIIGGVMLVIFILFTARPFAYWWTTDYVFTNRRIIVRTGLVARKGRDMPLSKVNNVSFDVSFWGRLLNYGVLTIDSASDQPLIIADVPDVEKIQMDVNRLHEEDDVRRRGIGQSPDQNA
jgi:hypothetical protein